MFEEFIAIGIYTNNFKRAVYFYKNVLKLKIRSYDPEKEFAEFLIGNVVMGLINPKTAKELSKNCKYKFINMKKNLSFTIAIKVRSIDKIYRTLSNTNHIEIVSAPHTTSWGWKIMLIRDINNCVWEVCELPK